MAFSVSFEASLLGLIQFNGRVRDVCKQFPGERPKEICSATDEVHDLQCNLKDLKKKFDFSNPTFDYQTLLRFLVTDYGPLKTCDSVLQKLIVQLKYLLKLVKFARWPLDKKILHILDMLHMQKDLTRSFSEYETGYQCD